MNNIFARAPLLVLFAASSLAAGAAQYTAVDLYPMPGAGYITPAYDAPISGAFGGQVVAGSVLWKPDGSMTDLTPAGYQQAQLNGTDGIHQWGEVYVSFNDQGGIAIPAVWSGSAASAIPLDTTGTGLIFARIFGSGGGQFVGTDADSRFVNHALLWNSLTAQPIDLTPANEIKGTGAIFGRNDSRPVCFFPTTRKTAS